MGMTHDSVTSDDPRKLNGIEKPCLKRRRVKKDRRRGSPIKIKNKNFWEPGRSPGEAAEVGDRQRYSSMKSGNTAASDVRVVQPNTQAAIGTGQERILGEHHAHRYVPPGRRHMSPGGRHSDLFRFRDNRPESRGNVWSPSKLGDRALPLDSGRIIIPRMRPDPMSERLDESTEKRGDTYKHYNILGGRTGRGTALEYNTTRQAAVTTGDPRGGPNGGVD